MQPVGDGDFASKREGRSLVIQQIQAARQELFLAVGARQGLKMVVGSPEGTIPPLCAKVGVPLFLIRCPLCPQTPAWISPHSPAVAVPLC